MFGRKTAITAVSILTITLCSCATSLRQKTLTVDIGKPVQYISEQGDRFVARYGSLSDGSLHFVKLKMPDGREYTLPQVVSASGVRYTDERELVWWTHQGTVRVDVRDTEGNWTTKYQELREAPEKK
ncbi:MliC family protein [bacterium]|nr:MliC family protein [bacterium]